VLILYIFAFY